MRMMDEMIVEDARPGEPQPQGQASEMIVASQGASEGATAVVKVPLNKIVCGKGAVDKRIKEAVAVIHELRRHVSQFVALMIAHGDELVSQIDLDMLGKIARIIAACGKHKDRMSGHAANKAANNAKWIALEDFYNRHYKHLLGQQTETDLKQLSTVLHYAMASLLTNIEVNVREHWWKHVTQVTIRFSIILSIIETPIVLTPSISVVLDLFKAH